MQLRWTLWKQYAWNQDARNIFLMFNVLRLISNPVINMLVVRFVEQGNLKKTLRDISAPMKWVMAQWRQFNVILRVVATNFLM